MHLTSRIMLVASFSFTKFTCGHGLFPQGLITCVLGVARLLALSKFLSGIRLMCILSICHFISLV